MKLFLSIIYVALFGLAWPIYVGGRARGWLALACGVAPSVAFWFGYFAK